MTLKLTKLKKDDIFKIMKWRMLQDVTKYMFSDPKITKESQISWYNKISRSKKYKYWIIEYENNKIGLIYLHDIDYNNKRCFWGYYIADMSYRGKGLARNLECNIYDYVFYHLGLNKLCGEIFEENDKVIKIHQKYGSKIEGIFKEHILKNKKYHNVVRIAILKEEWDAIRSNINYDMIKIE